MTRIIRSNNKKTISSNGNDIISGQTTNTGPRRGRRHPKPTERYIKYRETLKGPSKSKAALTTASAVDKFMIQLYAEIVAAAVSPIGKKDRIETRDLLRQARTLRFFDLYPRNVADDLKRALTKSQPPRKQDKKVVQCAINDLQVSHPERLVNFIKTPNLFVLSICCHSQTFRAAIQRDNADSKAESLPRWGDILPKIKKFSSSLELVAKTRDLDWEDALRAFDTDYDRLIKCCFKGGQHARNIDHTNFGIGPSDLYQLHHPTDHIPHHWVVPKRKESAKRCQFEYQYNCDLDKENFYGRRVPGRLNGGGRPTIGERQLAWQVDMAESRVLDTYDWSKLSDQGNGDPRFDAQSKCHACGKKTDCSCSLSDYYERHKGQPNALVELFDTGKLGTGVRALQALKKDAILGEYIGEIYPLRDPTRYRTEMYVFSMEVQQGRRAKKGGAGNKKAEDPVDIIVDPAIYGNWTRYINHSCQPNAAYVYATVGRRKVILIQTLRDVNFGEELTSNYGEGYFINMGLECICGAEECRSRK
ncbi:hypothetical protein RBB50_010291 [Rhinocladiella similis]